MIALVLLCAAIYNTAKTFTEQVANTWRYRFGVSADWRGDRWEWFDEFIFPWIGFVCLVTTAGAFLTSVMRHWKRMYLWAGCS
jgi:hypothetical protein